MRSFKEFINEAAVTGTKPEYTIQKWTYKLFGKSNIIYRVLDRSGEVLQVGLTADEAATWIKSKGGVVAESIQTFAVELSETIVEGVEEYKPLVQD